MTAPPTVHATALVLGGTGVLIRGAARSGKSALAFAALRRAELLGRPAALVADDRVILSLRDGALFAEAPAALRGLIEVSGVGILAERFEPAAVLHLLVELAEPPATERLPEPEVAFLEGVALRRLVLPAREAALGADVLQRLALAGDR